MRKSIAFTFEISEDLPTNWQQSVPVVLDTLEKLPQLTELGIEYLPKSQKKAILDAIELFKAENPDFAKIKIVL